MLSKEKIIMEIIDTEGGFVDNPKDPGGATKYGITERVARANEYVGRIQDITVKFAFSIYEKQYWKSVKADDIILVDENIAKEVVDTCINMGAIHASKFLQKTLNVLDKGSVKIDGKIGPKTLEALKRVVDRRGAGIILVGLNCLQGARYIRISEQNEKLQSFTYGWLKNRIG